MGRTGPLVPDKHPEQVPVGFGASLARQAVHPVCAQSATDVGMDVEMDETALFGVLLGRPSN